MSRAIFAVLVLAPMGAAAASDAGHGPNWGILGTAIFNVIVLALLLVRLTRRPLRSFLVQRRRGIEEAIEQAEARVNEAQAEVERWRSRQEGVEAEAAEFIRRAADHAEAESQRRLERADDSASRIQREAHALAEQEVTRAREMLRAEVAELATSLADGLLRERIRPEDDRRLISEYTEQIGGTA